MIVLVGESASGKSYMEKQLITKGYEKIVSYTTRPMRDGEVNGIDYNYITLEKFKELKSQSFFAEYTCYNGWYYGIANEDCLDNKVVVVEPYGLRQLEEQEHLKIQSFYIKVDERERAIRMIKRGDNLLEVFRRVFSDQGVFQGVENEVNFIIDNNNFDGLDKILKILKT